jgi:DNA polymerase I-like protein with 3'-5' exonuclease and polymerase domains
MATLPSWADAKRVCIDVETCDQHLKQLGIGVRRGGFVTGYSFTIEDGPSFYLPVRHEGGDNLDQASVVRYLQDQGKVFTGDIVGANLSYDLDYLWENEILFPQVRYYRDIQIADPLIYELHDSYSLQNIALRHGLAGKDEALLHEAARAFGVDPKGGMWRLPARYVGPYAEADTQQPLMVLRRQERKIDEEDLWNVYNLESRVLPALVRMRRRGVRVDLDKLREVEEWSLTQEAEALALIKHQTGVQIAVGDVWKAGALAPALEALGVKLEETSTGQPQIDKFLLGSLDHPVAKAMGWARKVNKLRTTFAASVRTYMVNGRIHCTFNQIARETEGGDQKGARYGRLSCTDPNLQQQPSRDEFAAMWRSIYVPEEGGLWAANDYSQQEPRWTTHFAAVMNLPKAREAAQAYWDNPDLDNHQFMADLTGLPRKFAKNIYLGLCYGEGGAKLSRDCGLPTRWALAAGRGRERKVSFFATREETLAARRELEDAYMFETAGEEGQEIIDKFDSRAPFIRKLAKAAESRAKSVGHITTVGGRKLHFPQRNDGSYDWAHKALNRLIQGSSADQTKEALVALDEAGHFLQLQVHDEIDGTVASVEEANAIADVMSNIRKAEVPFRVDTEIGPSWGEAK